MRREPNRLRDRAVAVAALAAEAEGVAAAVRAEGAVEATRAVGAADTVGATTNRD